jgi:hypothetical protein
MATISRAIIKSYDVVTHSATVQIAGSLAVWLDAVPVSDGIAPADVVAGRECGVIFFADDNPNDAAVVTVHNAVPIGGRLLRDADADTYVDVERTPDEDKIAMGVAGTLRWLLQNASPHAQLTGDFQASGSIAARGTTPNANYYFSVEEGGDNEGKVGLAVNLGGLLGFGANTVVGIGGHAYASNTSTTTEAIGLDFGVGSGPLSGTLAGVTGIKLSFNVSGSVTTTNMRGLFFGVMSPTGSAVVTNFIAVDVPGSGNSRFRTMIGLRWGNMNHANITAIPLDLDGPARTTNTDGSVHRMNFQFGSRTRSFAGGDGVIGLSYATTNPPGGTNPTGGIVMWASSTTGDTRFKGAGGQTVTLPTGGAPNVTGSRGGNAALASLLTTLAGMGYIVDGTT